MLCETGRDWLAQRDVCLTLEDRILSMPILSPFAGIRIIDYYSRSSDDRDGHCEWCRCVIELLVSPEYRGTGNNTDTGRMVIYNA